MLLAVLISSYECTWEVWRALKKLELLKATLAHLSYSPNFLHASIQLDINTLSMKKFLNLILS